MRLSPKLAKLLLMTLQPDTLLCRSLWLRRLSYRLDLCLTEPSHPVESDYTVVFFAAGSSYTPGWNWMWKAYRSLSRKYRKNLKRLARILPSFPKTHIDLAH